MAIRAIRIYPDPVLRVQCRAVTDFDSPHVLVVSGVYNLPFGRGQRFFGDVGKAANMLFGGWEYSVIAQYRSGRPVNLPGNADLIADPRGDRIVVTLQADENVTLIFRVWITHADLHDPAAPDTYPVALLVSLVLATLMLAGTAQAASAAS